MSCINKVMLIGNLGADPESRFMPSGEAICTLRLATTEKWKDKATGVLRESTEWHRVVLFRRLAEVAAQYLSKGSQVYIEGSLRTRKWQDREGRDHYTTEVEARDLTFLGSRVERGRGATNTSTGAANPLNARTADARSGRLHMDPDDLPF